MAEVENVLTTENQSITNYDYSKIFLTNFKQGNGVIDNAGAELELVIGTMIGRIAATGKLAVMKSASTDGSQLPLGILARDYTLGAASTDNSIAYATECKVDESKLTFDGTDDLTTVVGDKNYRDHITGGTEDIKLESVGEFFKYDNQ